MERNSRAFVGIDLGTTNSVMATIDSYRRPVSLANSEGDILTPSVVFVEANGATIVGKEAAKAGILEPEGMIDAAKRDMGNASYHRMVRGRQYSPVTVSSMILKRLREDASLALGDITRAVVTVPAYFNEPRRRATAEAARLAGFQEVELLNEPTAAALAFGHSLGLFDQHAQVEPGLTKIPGQLNLFVYDLGGGTFDVTVMQIADRHFRAIVSDGDVCLGGRDWDERIVQYAAQCFHRECDGIDLLSRPEALVALRVQAEELKRSLTARMKSVMRVQTETHRLAIELSRQDLLELTGDLLSRTRLTCELALMDAKKTWSEIDVILLVGGSSRMPMVREMLLDMSGIEPTRCISPDEAVAHGAAIYAEMVFGTQGQGVVKESVQSRLTPSLQDINSHSLGVVGRDEFQQRRVAVLIPKNSPIPQSNSRIVYTRRENQRRIVIQVVEGESHDPEACALIGQCILTDLPEHLPAGTPVEIVFSYRRDGRLIVTSKLNGRPAAAIEIERESSSTASKDTIKAPLTDQKHAKERQRVDIRHSQSARQAVNELESKTNLDPRRHSSPAESNMTPPKIRALPPLPKTTNSRRNPVELSDDSDEIIMIDDE